MFASVVLNSNPSSFSELSVSSPTTSLTDGCISYDATSNIMTVTGYSLSRPCTFWDLWNASNVNGWNVVANNRNNNMQYDFDCRISIGGGGINTCFLDSNKEIVFSSNATSSVEQNIIDVKDEACFQLGILEDPTAKSTSQGCTIIDSSGYWLCLLINGARNANISLYSSTFINNGPQDHRMTLLNNARVWNCVLGYKVGIWQSTVDFFNTQIQKFMAAQAIANSRGTFERVTITDSDSMIYVWYDSTASMKDLYARNGGYIRLETLNYQDFAIINGDLDSWAFVWQGICAKKCLRQYEFDLMVTYNDETKANGANVSIWDNTHLIRSWVTNSTGQIPTQSLTIGFYNQTGGNTLYPANPFNLTITAIGCQTYTQNFTLTQKTNWTIAMLPLNGRGMIEHAALVPVDPGLASPSGTYRWLDVADQTYGIDYQHVYNYSQAAVEVAYCVQGSKLQGTLTARNLKPNFAYQLKVVGTPGTFDNERIGLAGRWWQEEWTGSSWSNGQNLNNKGDGSSPNPNDQTYSSRRLMQDTSSPTGCHYQYTGYLVFDYFITDSNGTATLQFETGRCYHVLWKASQQNKTTNDGALKTVTFDPDPSQSAYDTDYPSNTVSIFGEWERLPMDGVNLQSGEYTCQILLTEESFHGSGESLAGNWAGAMVAGITFTIEN